MKLTTVVNKEIAKKIEKASNGSITFTFEDSSIRDVHVKVNEDIEFSMTYKDYSVRVLQHLPELVYCVSYIVETIEGDTLPMIKEFETEEERKEFTDKLDKDFTLTERRV